MSYPRRLILALPILLCILIQVKAVEVNVVKYEGLRSTELKRPDKRNQFYEFEFCLCPHNVQLRSEKRGHPKCECAPPKKGKRVADSTPYAIFPTSCLVKPNPRTCLGASFNKDNDRLFVKVSVGGIPVTQPAWQELPMAQYKRTESLVSTATMPLKLTYTTTHKTPTSTTTMRPWKLKTAKPAPIFKLITPKDQEAVVDESLIPKTRVTKAIQSWTSNGKDEISSVSYYSDIDKIRRFLLQVSLKDRIHPPYFDTRTFKSELTTYHNIFRRKHGAAPLQYDMGLERAAQLWANELGRRRGCLVHEAPRIYGENLFYFGARNFPSARVMAHMVTQSFYMEGVGYNYNQFYPMSYYKTGHFTQLVWKGSRRMGVGVSIIQNNGRTRGPCQPNAPLYMIYVVVKYDPAGNFQTRPAYLENVRPPVY